MKVSRDEAARMGREAVDIMVAGGYDSPRGRRIHIMDLLKRANLGTVSYPPETPCPLPEPQDRTTPIDVLNATTLVAAREVFKQGGRPAALNFASATHPGGGFLDGARAQEESLCWSSGLYACLLGNAMYEFHQKRDDTLYTDYVLYSPDVPVFRGEDGALLERPWPCSFLTAAAPFTKLFLLEHPDRESEIPGVFRSRIAKVLAVAARHGHEDLVLGAWGCGAFGNDPTVVAPLFREALEGPFRGVFASVVFAVRDSSPDRYVLEAFASEFSATGDGHGA